MPGGNAGSAPALPKPSDSTRWADLRLRIASAAVLAPLALGCAIAGGLWWLALLVLTFAGVCWEWWALSRGRPVSRVAGLVYAALAVTALHAIRSGPGGSRSALVFLLMVVWGSDIGAYVAGRLVGGRKLAPRISPGKTWSGAAGGLATSVIAGTVVAYLAGAPQGPAAVLAAALGVASQCGDLGESALKRVLGVKDSGRLIPGHGGLLDRLDGLMAAALAASGWAWASGSGILQ